MADDGERTDKKTTDGQPDALPDPVDLNARREQRQASNGASYPSSDAADSMQRAYEDISDELADIGVVLGDPPHPEELGNRRFVSRGVIANVHRCEVEAERLDVADDVVQVAAEYVPFALGP